MTLLLTYLVFLMWIVGLPYFAYRAGRHDEKIKQAGSLPNSKDD